MIRFKAVLAAALLWCSAAAQAHNFHVGLTEISFNQRTGSTEVVHTYTAHDVEALLMNLYQRQFDLGLEEDQAVFRRYLEKQFRISVNGKPVALHWVGMQANVDSITVFQEIEKTALPPGAVLLDGMLTDFLPQQVNNVNVSAPGRPPASIVFNRDCREQPLP
ncbi:MULTISPECIES: DUF6702 family protein [unclassified Duganella]|uniref:DUF6702 family protein n=1 Tax=unclassified Duganella TaxID=2636909 RepID=UPI0006F9C3B6|nr:MULTISPECIES: DUF6702 family protein [unclassified Duganella]KQV54011.1 hypothetical protein ASD07_05570 [Duganella sp. Root336D2]KRB98223.1 hypothetical protein ASE26_25245 [Duganella sp. Root198D2]